MRGCDGSVGSTDGGPRGPRAAPAGESDHAPASSRRDITVDLPISPWEGVLGAEIEVQTSGAGRPSRCPRAAPPVGGCGCAARACRTRGRPGDLYAELKVTAPSRPTPRERELFEELAKVSTFDPRR
jgi:curved DNA-binding protein